MKQLVALVAAFLSAAILTACGGDTVLSSSTPTSVARSQFPLGPHAAHGVTEKVLHTFAGGSDGSHPLDEALIAANGTFYSSTEHGGGSGCESSDGCGTVFKMSTSGTESVLYSFKGEPDGQYAKGGEKRRFLRLDARRWRIQRRHVLQGHNLGKGNRAA
jgi:hypothetical protein